jgi:outer membrane protein OmpA-like peptidoglycan-associated protein
MARPRNCCSRVARLSGYPCRFQLLWVALLALAWLELCVPQSGDLNTLTGALIVGVVIITMVWMTQRTRIRRRVKAHTLTVIDSALRAFPSDLKRHTPLIISVGDPPAMASVWGSDEVRLTDAAIWVRCSTPSELMHLVDALKRWRNGQGPDAVTLLIAADQSSAETPASVWKSWRSAIGAANRVVGYVLPICVAAYAVSRSDDKGSCPWFGISSSTLLNAKDLPASFAPQLWQYLCTSEPAESQTRAQHAALLDALVRWSSTTLLPSLTGGRSPLCVTAFGVTAVRGVTAPSAPFSRYITRTTGLKGVAVDRLIPSRYPLPDALLAGICFQPVRREWPRVLAHSVIVLASFFCLGAAASAWQNRNLMRRVSNDVARYQSILPAQDTARIDALQKIKHDRDELEEYANAGVPTRLGFGLYRGGPWLPIVNDLIVSYQPPAPLPTVIELNSMSLFESGSAVLSQGSNRVLFGALETIKAHPYMRVLIAGHTDSEGDAAANLVLSNARAAAVRDWLVDASGLAATRFAIQGYGDTRPKASNDTEAGRAANRRVEITLVPDCHDNGSRLTPGHPACS